MRIFKSLYLLPVLLTLLAFNLLFNNASWALGNITVQLQSGQSISVNGQNIVRPDNAVVLYNPDFGESTKTNPYGVEILAKPVIQPTGNNDGLKLYQVESVSSIWDCQQSKNLAACGNKMIPSNGIILSASGDKRQALLDALKPGTTFQISQSWFEQSTFKVTAINPNLQNNTASCGFPGCRGGQQLVVYNSDYGKTTTGTNEFGFEVTISNGIVVDHDGNDSTIPNAGETSQNFVLSGHGTARNWLIAHTPIGAAIHISPDGTQATSTINYDTYKFQLDQRLEQSKCLDCSAREKLDFTAFRNHIRIRENEADHLYGEGQQSQAVQVLVSTLDLLDQRLWTEFPAFPQTAIKGIWHRPVETSPQAIAATLDRFKHAGLNTVFLETVFHGYTIFPSETMHQYGLPVQNPKLSQLDYLKTWTDLAHQRGMKIHTWIHTFYAGTKSVDPPGPILKKYPEWANVQYSALSVIKVDPNSLHNGLSHKAGKPAVSHKPASHQTASSKPKPLQLASSANTANSKTKLYAKTTAQPTQNRISNNSSGGIIVALVKPKDLKPKNLRYTEKAPEKIAMSETQDATDGQYGAPTPNSAPTPSAAPIVTPVNPSQPKSDGEKPRLIYEAPKTPVASTLEVGGYFLDPANPAVQDFMAKLVQEIYTRYPVDGIQLDYIRYPASFPKDRYSYQKTTWGYTNYARQKFKGTYGVDPAELVAKTDTDHWEQWESFKADQVSRFVQRVHDDLKSTHPNVQLSTVIFPDSSAALFQKHQDWHRWANNQWVDFLSSITLTSSVKMVGSDTTHVLNAINQRAGVLTGVFGPFNGNSPENLLQQIEAARQSGATGFGIFDSAHLTARMGDALAASQGKVKNK